MRESHGLEERPVDRKDATRRDDQSEAHLALQGQRIVAAGFRLGGPLIRGHAFLLFDLFTVATPDLPDDDGDIACVSVA
jgi:hypothetical protein